MRILGVVSESHDTGVALVEDGRVLAVLEEERHSRRKHTKEFPARSLRALLGDGAHGLAGIDLITTPWDTRRLRRTFARTFLGRLPASLNLLLPGVNVMQDSGVLLLSFWLRYGLRSAYPGVPLPPIVNVGHHEAHAAMFFVSPSEEEYDVPAFIRRTRDTGLNAR